MSDSNTVVVGGGIIGLSCAYTLKKAGHDVAVIDRDFDGDKTSLGNAGGIAVTDCMPISHPGVLSKVPKWLIDPLGPLSIRPSYAHHLIPWLWHFYRAGRASETDRYADALSALNNRALSDLRSLLADLELIGDLEETGALVLYRHRRSFEKDKLEWEIKKSREVRFELLTRQELVEMEPAVGPTKTFGVFQPQWSLLRDPKKLVRRLSKWLNRHGVRMVDGEATAVLTADNRVYGVRLSHSATVVYGSNVIVAGGAWSGALANQAGDRVLLGKRTRVQHDFAGPKNYSKSAHYLCRREICRITVGGWPSHRGCCGIRRPSRTSQF